MKRVDWQAFALELVGAFLLTWLGSFLARQSAAVMEISPSGPPAFLWFIWCVYLALVVAFLLAVASAHEAHLPLPSSSVQRTAASEDESPRFATPLEHPEPAEGGRSARVLPFVGLR